MLKKLFSPEDRDICPNCGESCATSAILCPRCGKNLDELFEQLSDLEVTHKPNWLTKVLATVNIIKAKYLPHVGLLVFIVFSIFIRVHLANFFDTTPPQDVIITVERTMCFGWCPDYRLSIYGNGKVVYEGRNYVRVEGKRTTYIPRSKVRELVAEFEKIQFYEFDDKYIFGASDLPSVLVSIDLEGRSKTIDMYGAEMIAPEEIANLIKQIEEAVNVTRWVGKGIYYEGNWNPNPGSSLTQRAPDWWESARFQALCVAWSWLRQNGAVSSHPPAGNAHRWAHRSDCKVCVFARN